MQLNQSRKMWKRQLLFSVGMSLFFLSGCGNFNGVASERYDGQKVEKDTQAIEMYEQRQEIAGEAKDLYLTEPFSPDMLRSPLSFSDGPWHTLESKTYTIGKELPQSRYTISLGKEFGKGNIRLEDSEGVLKVEEYLHANMGVVHLEADFYEGDQLIISGAEEGELIAFSTEELPEEFKEMPIFSNMTAKVGEIILGTGMWHVGKHVKPGEYQLINQPPNGYVYIFSPNQLEPSVIELKGDWDVDPDTQEVIPLDYPLSLSLVEGQALYIRETRQIELVKK